MIKQLLNSVIAKYRDLSVSRTSIICLSFRLRQIIDLLATDKSRYFAQPRPIIVNYYYYYYYYYYYCLGVGRGRRRRRSRREGGGGDIKELVRILLNCK